MNTKVVTVIFLLTFFSCSQIDRKSENLNDRIIPEWDVIKIESRNQTIIIEKHESYGVRDTCDFKEVEIDDHIVEYKPINRGKEYFKINQQEKDSLFKYVYDIVSNPVYTDQFATCYVGNISISFSVGNTTQTCKYNSVGDWTMISPSIQSLYRLLKAKTKIF